MDIKQLKYFQVIAEEKHITAAAKKLNMSQPPLSQQLKLLENELGCTLFIRTSKSMELTQEGQYLLEQANLILKNHNSIIQSFLNMKSGKSGNLRIGTICSAAANYLPKTLSEFYLSNQGIHCQVFEDTTSNILNMIDDESIELGIVKEPFDHSQYDHYYIESLNQGNQFVSVARNHYFSQDSNCVSLLELDNVPLILHSAHHAIITHALESAGLKAQIAWTANNIHTMLLWAQQDLGIAIMPYDSSALSKYLAGNNDIAIKTLDNPCYSPYNSLVWAKNHTLSPSARQLISFIKSLETFSSRILQKKTNFN